MGLRVGRVGAKPHARRRAARGALPAAIVLCAGLALPASAMATAATAISAGGGNTCAILRTGAMQCWGGNVYGEVGDGTRESKASPTPVQGLGAGVLAIGVSWDHTCAVTIGGAAQCWGGNYSGEVGDGTTEPKATPAAVSGLGSGVISITAGGSHTCALNSSGGVECWGLNDRGELGDGTKKTKITPVGVSGLESGVAAVSAGEDHTCALTSAGAVECWGADFAGQLGDGETTDRTTPVPVTGLSSGVVAISAGAFHTCALTSAGAVECWGDNAKLPVAVGGFSEAVTAIGAGSHHTCAITVSGAMECWGSNGYGQLGDGTVKDKSSPTPVFHLAAGVTAIAAGGIHTCALTTGPAKCWGQGGIGDGTKLDRTIPVDVLGLYRSTCASNAGTVKLSPGVAAAPAVQNVTVKGSLSGCTGGAFATIKYTATLTTSGPVSCATLVGAGETATGAAGFKWIPKSQPATGSLSLLASESPGAPFSGEVSTGAYAPLALSGTITTTYKGAATCGQPSAPKPVTKGTFSGSEVQAE